MTSRRTGGQGASTEEPGERPRPHQLDLPFDPTPVPPEIPGDRELDTTDPGERSPRGRAAPERKGAGAPERPHGRVPSPDTGPHRRSGAGERDPVRLDRDITRLGVRVHGRIYSSPAVQAAWMAGERRVRVAVDAADRGWIFALVHGAWHRVPCQDEDAPVGKRLLHGAPTVAATAKAAKRTPPPAGAANVIDLAAARRKRSASSQPPAAGS